MIEQKKSAGRPKHEPTDENIRLVRTLSGYGVPQEEIARQIGIHQETLRSHYRDELDAGVAQANAKVAESLYKKAIGDGPQSASSAMFWLKTRAQWKETQNVEHSGPNGGPIEHAVSKIEHTIVDPNATDTDS
jgi:transposase-like protein